MIVIPGQTIITNSASSFSIVWQMLMKGWILIRNTRSERLDQNVMAFKGDLQFITARQDHIYGSNLAESERIFHQKNDKIFTATEVILFLQ